MHKTTLLVVVVLVAITLLTACAGSGVGLRVNVGPGVQTSGHIGGARGAIQEYILEQELDRLRWQERQLRNVKRSRERRARLAVDVVELRRELAGYSTRLLETYKLAVKRAHRVPVSSDDVARACRRDAHAIERNGMDAYTQYERTGYAMLCD